MRQFAELVDKLENTSLTNNKLKYLKEYFLKASEEDKVWVIALFNHKRPKRQVNTKLLRQWIYEASDLPPWLVEECYHVVGDFAETLALLTPNTDKGSSDHSLTYWVNYLIRLNTLEEEQKKSSVLMAWKQLSRQERFVFNKLITGGFRIGVSAKLISRALAEIHDIDPSIVTHKIMGKWNPQKTAYDDLILNDQSTDNLSKPYPFYLAYPLEQDISDLGHPDDWNAEWKWDGIRIQLIKRSNEIFLWSRGEDLLTGKFSEINLLIDFFIDDFVIDGELLPYKNGEILPFHVLQTRIGRKTLSKKILSEAPCAIFAYDILEYEGKDIRKKTFKERRAILKNVILQIDKPDLIKLSDDVIFNKWSELEAYRRKADEFSAEGLMIKRNDSVYKTGRRRGDWWKWKVDPMTVDAVMIYAQKGHGRRADIFSDYTLAVWHEGELVPFAKAYSGLTDVEMREVNRFIKKNTTGKYGPVRTVAPELVFEIAFEGIQRSNRHKSGIAVRFPRIHRWRKDKNAKEANNLEDLLKLLRN